MLVRGAIALPIIVILSFLGLGTLRPIRTWAVGLRSLLIAISMFFYFGSLSFMPIAQGLAELFISPILILLITAFILKECSGLVRIVAVNVIYYSMYDGVLCTGCTVDSETRSS